MSEEASLLDNSEKSREAEETNDRGDILGTGAARLQPVVRGNLDEHEIVPRLMMPLVLAFDHRVLDGAEAARFVGVIVDALKDPEKLLLTI